ncbi:unnamed protein product, partial [Rotaria magnacalcarata]
MNPKEFFSYVEANYTIEFANFLCHDLKIVNQALLTNMPMAEILEMGRCAVPRIQSTSIDYYVVDPNNRNMAKKLNNSAILTIKLLKKALAPNKKRTGMFSYGDQITTSTTETDLDGDKENFRKRLRAAAANEILDRKRRCRKGKICNNHDQNDIEWSFSSDEDYNPPLLEQLYPSSVSSPSDRA